MKGTTITLLSLVALLLNSRFSEAQNANTPVTTPTLSLVLAKTNILGNFLGPQAVCSDRHNIYLASYQGNLFVLDKSRKDYPVVATIAVSTAPLRSVRSDDQRVYATSADGNLYVYGTTKPFPRLAAIHYSPYGLNSLYVDDGSLIVSTGQGEMTADGQRLYLSELNSGDIAIGIDKLTLIPTGLFGQTFQPATTLMYARSTGALLGSIANPLSLFGQVQAVNLYVDGRVLMQTTPGCCGLGLYMYDTHNQRFLGFLSRPSANTAVSLRSGLLAVGTEAGTVDMFDITNPAAPLLVTSADLRQLTGHTGPEDIEIRSIWEDEQNGKIYAGSSWGNDASRGPLLPAFFVLDLK